MTRRLLGVVLTVLLLAWLPAGVVAPAAAGPGGHGPRPDLVVSKGSAGLAGTALTGSVQVKAKGQVRAKRSVAAVHLRAGGQDVVVQRVAVPRVRPGQPRTVSLAASLPAALPPGPAQVQVCADGDGKVKERSEKNNCRTVGTVVVPGPASSVPGTPIAFTAGQPFRVQHAGGDYWAYVPSSYDASHRTPTTLLVWLHGCGGYSQYDISTYATGYLSIALGGREGGCWNMAADPAAVLAAIADVKTHFNVAPRKVVIAGYSSGGDLAYRTAFYNARSFAGVLAADSSPFRDTGSSQVASLAAASWRFPVVHLAHRQDTTYPLAGVVAETEAMKQAGFPLTRVEVDGHHYDEAGAIVNGHPVPGTDADIVTHLLSYLADGWLAPAG